MAALSHELDLRIGYWHVGGGINRTITLFLDNGEILLDIAPFLTSDWADLGAFLQRVSGIHDQVDQGLAELLWKLRRRQAVDFHLVLIADDGRDWFRWHDSGDLQSVDHLARIAEVARQLPAVTFWLPTQERRVVRDFTTTHGALPANLTVRYSAPLMNHRPDPRQLASYVITGDAVPADVHACPAPTQNGECGSCRACWDVSVPTVAYRAH